MKKASSLKGQKIFKEKNALETGEYGEGLMAV